VFPNTTSSDLFKNAHRVTRIHYFFIFSRFYIEPS
jgi:hypothetical protein